MPGTPIRRGHFTSSPRSGESRGHLPRARVRSSTAGGGRDDAATTSTRSTSRRPSDAIALQTLFLDEETVLRTETSPSQPDDGGAGSSVVARPRVSARHARCDAFADLPPDRGPRRRRRHHARRPGGDARLSAEGALRRAPETRFVTHHFPFTEPSIEALVSCHICDGSGCPVCRHSGWIEVGGRDGRPQPVRVRRIRPRAIHRLRVRLGARTHRRPAARDPRSSRALAQRSSAAEAVLAVPHRRHR